MKRSVLRSDDVPPCKLACYRMRSRRDGNPRASSVHSAPRSRSRFTSGNRRRAPQPPHEECGASETTRAPAYRRTAATASSTGHVLRHPRRAMTMVDRALDHPEAPGNRECGPNDQRANARRRCEPGNATITIATGISPRDAHMRQPDACRRSVIVNAGHRAQLGQSDTRSFNGK